MQAKTSASKKAHEIKNAAFAFGVYGNNSKRIADVAVTNKGLVWSNGKASKDLVVKWDAFINWMESQLSAAPAKKKAPVKAKAAAPKAKAPAKSKAKKVTKARAKTNGTKRVVAKKVASKASAAKASASAATLH